MQNPLPNPSDSPDFSFFQAMIDKYRRAVHQLLGPPLSGTVELTVERLGFPLPADLVDFLSVNNGATLFRGALNLRSLEQLTPASTQYPAILRTFW